MVTIIIIKKQQQQLEALGECRPPWLPQIITPVYCLLYGVRFWMITCTTTWSYASAFIVCFVHLVQLLIFEDPDHHQNLISSSLYHPGPLHKISSQSVYNLLSNVVHKQTDRQTNATKNITSFCQGGDNDNNSNNK